MTAISALGQANTLVAPSDREFIAMYAPPYALRVTTVTRGTCASANAWSSFAPRRTTPPSSWSMPGRYPGMSTSTTSGTPNASHIRTNRAAFSADSRSRQPPSRIGLLAITPTVRPPSRPSTVTMFGAHFSLQLHYGRPVQQLGDERADVVGRAGRFREQAAEIDVHGAAQASLAAEQLDQPARIGERRILAVGDTVHDTAPPAVRVRPAELLGGDALAGDALDDRRAGHEHATLRRLDHDVGEGGAVRRTAGSRAEYDRDLGDLPRRAGHGGEHAGRRRRGSRPLRGAAPRRSATVR